MRFKLIAMAGIMLILGSCTPKLGYFQDVEGGTEYTLPKVKAVTCEPGDKLSIIVSSRNPQLAYLFNLPIVGTFTGANTEMSGSSRMASYIVGEDGTIQFPVLGALHVAGLTREGIQQKVRNELVDKDLLKDPTVTVSFLDMAFMVMGEVKTPGRYAFDHDKVNLLDALSRAGDLTINGVRTNVLVCREENGVQKNYRIDLTNAKELYSSPAFYLKQNDIVYVEPNVKKARESTSTGNAWASPSLWLSTASFITSLCVLIFK